MGSLLASMRGGVHSRDRLLSVALVMCTCSGGPHVPIVCTSRSVLDSWPSPSLVMGATRTLETLAPGASPEMRCCGLLLVCTSFASPPSSYRRT